MFNKEFIIRWIVYLAFAIASEFYYPKPLFGLWLFILLIFIDILDVGAKKLYENDITTLYESFVGAAWLYASAAGIIWLVELHFKAYPLF